MQKFYYYYNPVCTGVNTPTVFSSDPYVSAIKDLFISELQQLVYYIEKLKDFNIDMNIYTDKVIEFISILIVNLDFRKESFFVIFEDLYNNKIMLKKMYISACQKENTETFLLEDIAENLTSKDVILKILNDKTKKKQIKTKNKSIEITHKYLQEIMISLVLNACNCLIELKNLGINFDEGKNSVIKLLNSNNYPQKSENELKEILNNFSKSNYKIMQLLYRNTKEKFGETAKTKVALCTKKGKAILVSGKSLEDLEKILNTVQGLNINVYTHNGLINAFQYKKFKENSNLIGHYQYAENNYSLDFASFPGPIYLSGNSTPKIDIIRGQIYTSAKYPSFGIAQIENNDFTPLIKYALDSKGFDEDIETEEITIGYNEEEIDKNLKLIIDKYKNKEIKKILIIGLADSFNAQDKYIEDFIKIENTDDYIISFAYNSDRKNFLHINTCFDFALLYKIIEKLKDENISDDIKIFLCDCNRATISHIFNLIYLGVKNIFLGQCCPNIINPTLTTGLTKLYNIKQITTPEDDIKNKE